MKSKMEHKILGLAFSGLIIVLISGSVLILYLHQGVRVDNFSKDLLSPIPHTLYYDEFVQNMPKINNAQSNQIFKFSSPFFPSNAKLISSTTQGKTSDTLTLHYQGNDLGNVFNCQNSILNEQQHTTSFYYLNKNHQFACAMLINGNPDFSQELVLVENVDAVHFRFGEKNITGITSFKKFSEIQNIETVNNIEIQFLLRVANSSESTLDHQVYQVNQQAIGPYHDTLPRKVIRFTFPIQQN